MRILAALLGAVFSLSALAVEPAAPAPESYLEGRDYMQLDTPVRPANSSKIEVAEVFSYTCPHCFHFEPLIETWMKAQKADVELVQTHTSWSSEMEPYQRGYYTLMSLRLKDKAHMAVFNTIHMERKELANAEAWADFLAQFGANRQLVISTYNSFSVNSQIELANARVRGYQISGTPELIIDGRFRISSRNAGSQENMLKIAQFLVDKVRTERAKKH